VKPSPITIRMSEDQIEITEIMTNRTIIIDPHQPDFRKKHPALYGAWAEAYGKDDGGSK